MDKLTFTRCCPGLSFVNICERAMSNLNIGQAGLSLMMDPNADRFLIEDVIGGTTSMKAVRQNIYDYYAAVPITVDILKCRLALLDGGSNGS